MGVITALLGRDVIPGFQFMVLINLMPVWGVSNVRNIGTSLEYEVITEGGVNSHGYIIPRPVSDVRKLEITAKLSSAVLPGSIGNLFTPGEKLSAPVYIGVQIPGDKMKGISFAFSDCMILSQTFSELNAQESRLLETTVEIAYQTMYIINGVSFVF